MSSPYTVAVISGGGEVAKEVHTYRILLRLLFTNAYGATIGIKPLSIEECESCKLLERSEGVRGSEGDKTSSAILLTLLFFSIKESLSRRSFVYDSNYPKFRPRDRVPVGKDRRLSFRLHLE